VKIFKIFVILAVFVASLGFSARVSPALADSADTGGGGCFAEVEEYEGGQMYRCKIIESRCPLGTIPAAELPSCECFCRSAAYFEPSYAQIAQEWKEADLTKTVFLAPWQRMVWVLMQGNILGDIVGWRQVQGQTVAADGAIGAVSNLIAAMYETPPVSGREYLADVGKSLGLVSPVYAQQGIGFKGLEPILPLWKVFRNIAYIFFTLVFIVMGFAIMFRVKLNPQTAVTIQYAIPRVALALILVTFSYAIAGLVIDLLYLVLSLLINALALGGAFGAAEAAATQRQFLEGGFPTVMKAAFKGVEWVKIAQLGSLIGSIIPGLGTALGGLLVPCIFAVLLLFLLLKLFFELVKSYVYIIFAVIFGPFQIMMGVLPGSAGIAGWLRGLLANILVFPAVAAILLLAQAIASRVQGYGLWSPPMILGGDIGADLIPTIICLGLLLILQKIPEVVRATIQPAAKGGFQFGVAIGEALGPAKTIAKTGFYYGAETGISGIETSAAAAGRTTGLDVTAATVARKLLGLKK